MLSFFPKFFDLPAGIRTRVYIETGLVVHEELLLNPKGNKHDVEESHRGQSLALMLTCRQVNAETSFLFYSTNRFIVRYCQAGDLATLRIFRPKLLSALTCLTIQLNVANSSHGRRTPVNCPSLSDKLLQADDSLAQILLSEWNTTAASLSCHIKVDALDFGLICDVADAETAHRVVAPLYQWPTLANCHIRLSPKPSHDSGIRQIACNAGLKVEGKRAEIGFAGFNCLPLELRLRILEYTDLVTPLGKVSWILGAGRHSTGYRIVRPRPCSRKLVPCQPPYDVCHPNSHQACLHQECQLGRDKECPHYSSGWGWSKIDGDESCKQKCWTCSHYACQFRECWQARKRRRHQGQFCFCQRYHTSYTTLCHCWAPPTPLFLVSRSFRRDACEVFFGRNHFNIDYENAHDLDYQHRISHTCPRSTRYLESIFLNDIVPANALQYIRSLEMRFLPHNRLPLASPAQKYADFNFSSPERFPLAGLQTQANAENELVIYRDWQQTLDRIMSYQSNPNPGLYPLFPSLHIKACWIAALDTWKEYCSLGKIPPEEYDQAIDTLKAVAATFWPPMIHSDVLPQVLFAEIRSELFRAYYFVRPGQLQESHSIYEPPEIAMARRRADFAIERMVELEDGESDQVEGIWVEYVPLS